MMLVDQVDGCVDVLFLVFGVLVMELCYVWVLFVSFLLVELQIDEYCGYMISGIVQFVQNLMYCVWVEILQDDWCVECLGLIGLCFIDVEEVEQYVFDWVCQWIDCYGVSDVLVCEL